MAERAISVAIKVFEVGSHVTTGAVRPDGLATVGTAKVDVRATILAAHFKSLIDRDDLAVKCASNCERHAASDTPKESM
jgi:hypothetical protein